MDQDRWSAVDAYLTERLVAPDATLDEALAANAAAGLPPHDVSALRGKFLKLVARMIGARHVLGIGTLGAVSTIWFARALGEGGRVVTLEADPRHAAVARANPARAGVADRVDLRVRPALDSLPALAGELPFDTALKTVGGKGWDGFALALVE